MFFMNFRWLVLEAQTELDKKLGHFKYEDHLVEIRAIGRFQGFRHCFRSRWRRVHFQESRVGALDSSDRVDKFKKKISMKNIEYPWRNLRFCVKKNIFSEHFRKKSDFLSDFQKNLNSKNP